MSNLPTIRIFIASPSDVNPERALAKQVIERLGRKFSHYLRVEAVWWERLPLTATEHFQTLITRPAETDIVLTILWSKLGSPLKPDDWKGEVTGKTPVTGTEWEFENAYHANKQCNKPELLLYWKKSKVTATFDDVVPIEEQQAQYESVKKFINDWFIDANSGTAKAALHPFFDAGELEKKLEQHLSELLKRRLNLPEGEVATLERRWHEGSPYRGLFSFELEHAPIFFGRTKERQELRDCLIAQVADGHAFLLVFGASGSGKSSLVKAGLLADLKIPGMMEGVGLVRHAILCPSEGSEDEIDLIRELASALLSADALPELKMAPLNYTVESLAQLLRAAPEQVLLPITQGLACAATQAHLINDAQARLLLVVDQMEELFTLGEKIERQRPDFERALQALAKSGIAWVIATMRSDFFDRLVTVPVLSKMSEMRGRYLLCPPDEAAITQIICQPAWEAGLCFEKNETTGIALDEVLCAEATRDIAALPLLEFALDQLWEHRENDRLLTYQVYDDMGGMVGAITQKAEQVIEKFGKDAAQVMKSVFWHLVTFNMSENMSKGNGVTARRAAMSAFPKESRERTLVEQLLSARLLVIEGEGEEARIRLVHEALLEHWDDAKKVITDGITDYQIRSRLEQAASRWRGAKKLERTSLLLPSGVPLQEGKGLLKSWPGNLALDLVNYVQASVKAQQRQQRQRIFVGVSMALSLPLMYVLVNLLRMFWGVHEIESEIERQLVAIEKGCFDAGSPDKEVGRDKKDEQLHHICLEKNFKLGKFEVS